MCITGVFDGQPGDMTSPEPNETPGPDPEQTPGLEPGGSVPPGDTPPDAGSATRGLAPRGKATARGAKTVWLAGIGLVVLLIALFFVGIAFWLPW